MVIAKRNLMKMSVERLYILLNEVDMYSAIIKEVIMNKKQIHDYHRNRRQEKWKT